MIFSLTKEGLNDYLDTVAKALPTRSTIQVIENILLEYSENELIFTATNLEMDIRVKIPYTGDGSGKILLPPKIVDIVRYLPGPEVILTINPDNFRIDIQSGHSNYHLFGADPEEYPLIQPEDSGDLILTIDQSALRQILKSVIFAASADESRPAFNGVLFHFAEKQITLNASDTYRLVVKEIKDENWSFEEQRFLIPAKSLRELMKIMDDDGSIHISSRQKQVVFSFGNVCFATRVLEEKYPDVRGVIPKSYKSKMVVDRKLLEETVGRASLLVEGINQAAFFSIEDDGLEVKVSSQVGRMEEAIQGSCEGEIVAVYVNSRFVMDVLKVLDQKDVQIDFHGKNGPLIFKVPGDTTYLYLVLPIKME